MKENKKRIGRKLLIDPAEIRYTIRFNEIENVELLNKMGLAQQTNKTKFIKSCIFDKPMKLIKVDKSAMDYCMKLSQFHSQFRSFGNNYNQIVKALKSNFEEKRAMTLLYKLEKVTIDFVTLAKEILALSKRFNDIWLQK